MSYGTVKVGQVWAPRDDDGRPDPDPDPYFCIKVTDVTSDGVVFYDYVDQADDGSDVWGSRDVESFLDTFAEVK